MSTDSFESLTELVLSKILSWDPSLATQVGYHAYDGLLRDPSKEAISREAEESSALSSRLGKVDVSELTEDQKIDLDYATYILNLRLFETMTLRKHEKGSFAATELGNSLFFLFSRDRPSLEERLEGIISRLEAAPAFLEESMKLVTDPYRLWNEILLETGERMPRFLKELCESFQSSDVSSEQIGRLRSAARIASDSLAEYNAWMRRDVLPNSSGKISVGPELYRSYLKVLGYGVTPDETLSIAEAYLEDVNAKKADLALTIVGSRDSALAVRRMRMDHAPDFDGVLAEYRESVLRSREFIRNRNLVTIPDGELLRVTPTPSFMEHVVPYAAQYEPGKFDGGMTGQFLVTSTQGNPAILEEHNRVAITNTSVHEGYPGHHLHGVCANLNPSRIRILHSSPDFGEGWGLYCEDMMISEGYSDTPLGRLTVLNDLGFRIARQICDVKISMGKMGLQEAADLLMRETGTNAQAAISEAKSMTLSPAYYMSYFIGKLGVLQMREDAEATLGSLFSLRFFHDSLIGSGCMTMDFMRRALASRVKDAYGLDMRLRRETLYQFAMSRLSKSSA